MRRGIVLSAALVAMLVAMPMQAAIGAKPYREPFRTPVGGVAEPFSFIIPDRETACSFAMSVDVEVIGVYWLFSDGHEVEVNVATITITNLETGTTYVQRSDYRITAETAADGTQRIVIDGKRWMDFYEGDQGPDGEVGPGGAEYFVTGQQSFDYDPKKDVITSYELDGQAMDSCEVLA